MKIKSVCELTGLTDRTIRYYIEEFNPLDKAGSYGIQELPDGILDKYEGSFENASGYSEIYYIYRSDNASLGSTSVSVL